MLLMAKSHREYHRNQHNEEDDSDWVSCSDSTPRSSISPSDGQNNSLISTLKSKRKSWLTSFSLGRDRWGMAGANGARAGARVRSPRRSPDHQFPRHGSAPVTAEGAPAAPPKSPPDASDKAPVRPLAVVPGLNWLFQNLTRRSQSLTTTTAGNIDHNLARPSGCSHRTPGFPIATPRLLPHKNNVDGLDEEEAVAKTTRIHSLTATTTLNTSPPSTPCTLSRIARMDLNNPSRSPNLADLLTGLSSPEDATRKMAAFKLQSLINDPSFAEHFVISGGLPRLRTLILETNGNTLAYSLASFARLLEVDQGWEAVNNKVVEKARYPEYIH